MKNLKGESNEKPLVDKRLDQNALAYWDLAFNPFTKRPLIMDDINEKDLLVENDSIKNLDNIYNQIQDGESSKIILLIGERGSGKTTALRYIHNKLITNGKNTKFISIFCTVIGQLSSKSAIDIRRDIHTSLLKSFIETAETFRPHTNSYIKSANLALKSNNMNMIESECENAISLFSEQFNHICILMDDVDNYSPLLREEINNYFTYSQSFWDRLLNRPHISSNVCIIMSFTVPFYEITRRKKSYFGDIEINLDYWDTNDIVELIKKRLSFASKGKRININNYFEGKVIEEIIRLNDNNPIHSIEATWKIMQHAYQNNIKPITKEFCESILIHQSIIPERVILDLSKVFTVLETKVDWYNIDGIEVTKQHGKIIFSPISVQK